MSIQIIFEGYYYDLWLSEFLDFINWPCWEGDKLWNWIFLILFSVPLFLLMFLFLYYWNKISPAIWQEYWIKIKAATLIVIFSQVCYIRKRVRWKKTQPIFPDCYTEQCTAAACIVSTKSSHHFNLQRFPALQE